MISSILFLKDSYVQWRGKKAEKLICISQVRKVIFGKKIKLIVEILLKFENLQLKKYFHSGA